MDFNKNSLTIKISAEIHGRIIESASETTAKRTVRWRFASRFHWIRLIILITAILRSVCGDNVTKIFVNDSELTPNAARYATAARNPPKKFNTHICCCMSLNVYPTTSNVTPTVPIVTEVTFWRSCPSPSYSDGKSQQLLHFESFLLKCFTSWEARSSMIFLIQTWLEENGSFWIDLNPGRRRLRLLWAGKRRLRHYRFETV